MVCWQPLVGCEETSARPWALVSGTVRQWWCVPGSAYPGSSSSKTEEKRFRIQTLWGKGAVPSTWVAQILFGMFPCLHQVPLRQGCWTLEWCKSNRHGSSEGLVSHTSWRPLVWALASSTLTSPFTDLWISSSRNSLFLFYILFSIPTKFRLSSPGCLQTWLLPIPGISRLSIDVLIYV